MSWRNIRAGLLVVGGLAFVAVAAVGKVRPDLVADVMPPLLQRGSPTPAESSPARIIAGPVWVIDGETVELPGGERLRLSNIAAPTPTARPRCSGEVVMARKATETLAALVAGGHELRLIPEARPTHDRLGHRLGRLEIDGADAGEALVAAGVARRGRVNVDTWCGRGSRFG